MPPREQTTRGLKKMPAAKKSKKPAVTQTRCTTFAQQEIKALSKRLFRGYEKEHRATGINKPSSKVAVDALLMWAAEAGKLNGRVITEKNNLFVMISTQSEEE